jgi:hypothetical protein
MGAQYNFREPAPSRYGDRNPSAASEYDPLLPVQYYERVASRHTPSGELKLFFAILEDALRCYVRAKNCSSGAKRAEFVDARQWFFTRGTPEVFSFESVCSFLGIDPNWLRGRLESLETTDLPLKQFRTQRRRPTRPSGQRRGCRTAQSASASVNGHEANGNGQAVNGNHHGANGNGHASGGSNPVTSEA